MIRSMMTSAIVALPLVCLMMSLQIGGHKLDSAASNDADTDRDPGHRAAAPSIPDGGNCAGNVNQLGRDMSSCCGTVAYNNATHLCCSSDEGQTGPRVVEAIYGENSFCCNLGVFDARAFACCAGLPYNRVSQICCEDTMIRGRVYDSRTACCGYAVYDISDPTQVCCPDGHLGSFCCNSTAIGGSSNAGQECCGGHQAYNRATEICCDEVVRRKAFDSVSQCCGTSVYNSTSAVCCDGVLHCTASADAIQC